MKNPFKLNKLLGRSQEFIDISIINKGGIYLTYDYILSDKNEHNMNGL